MHGTFICNVKQIRSLLIGQWSRKVNVPFNPIQDSFFRLALGTIDGVYLRMSQIDNDLRERPSFPPGVHPQGNRSTGAQGGEQEIVRRWARVCAALGACTSITLGMYARRK